MSVIAHKRPAEGSGRAPLRVMLADDHPLILAGIRRTLERNAEIEVAGEARCGRELLELVGRRRPNVVLMDLRMPDIKGTECIQEIVGTWPEVKVVVLSACDDRTSIDGALAAGASAYIVKSVEPVDIASVLLQTQGSTPVFYPASRPRPVIGRIAPDEPAHETSLSEREAAVLAALAAGKTTALIGAELWLSEHTVKYHLTNIYRKLGATNRAAAVRNAFEQGLLLREGPTGTAA